MRMERATTTGLGRTLICSLEDGPIDRGCERLVGRPALAPSGRARAGGDNVGIDVHERLLHRHHLRGDEVPDGGGGGDGREGGVGWWWPGDRRESR